MKRVLTIIFICSLLIAMHVMAHASGYGIFTQGARALGRADASVARLDSPSAIFFNPALLSGIDGTRGEVGTTFIVPERSYAGPPGAETEDSFFFPSTLYLSHELNDTLTLGFGVFNPFGLGTDWPNDWAGRYLATRSEIVTYDIRPVVAWQVTPALSLSAGVDYVYLEAELERMLDLSAVPTADGNQLFEGDGDGFGFNLGLAWQINDRFSLGLAWRSEVDIDIDATTTFRLPTGLNPLFVALFPKTGANASLTLPEQLFAGLACEINENLMLEFAVRQEGWSAFDALHIRLDQPIGPLGITEEVQPRKWDDTFAYSVGGEYRLNDSTTLLAGYLYGENPVPDATFEPAIPDSDSHLFCIGAVHRRGSYELAASYGYQHQLDRTKNNATAANGRYESDLHLIGFSLGVAF